MAWPFLLLVAVHVGLLWVFDLASRIRWTLTLMLTGFLVLAIGFRLARSVRYLRPSSILLGAVILRLLALPLPSTLSDDVLRYVWDGRVLGAGHDPYSLAPEAEELASLRDELWQELPHKSVPTVYPPLALGFFAFAAHLPVPVLAFKALVAGADIGTCALLLLIAARRGVESRWTLWYAWNPLVVLETAGMGHVDGLGILAVTGTVVLLMYRPRSLWAAPLAAAAVAMKVIPVVALPGWVRAAPKRGVFVVVCGLLLIVVFLPVVLAAGGVPKGYISYGVSWEFNGPLYEPGWRLLAAVGADSWVAAGLDAAKRATGATAFWNRLYPFNYPQLLAKVVLAVFSVPFFVWVWARRDAVAATGGAFGVLLLFSSTVYPWYLLWALPWAALLGRRSWLLLSALMPLAYLPQFTDTSLLPVVYACIWLPFFVMLALESRWSAA